MNIFERFFSNLNNKSKIYIYLSIFASSLLIPFDVLGRLKSYVRHDGRIKGIS